MVCAVCISIVSKYINIQMEYALEPVYVCDCLRTTQKVDKQLHQYPKIHERILLVF